ncbi:MAG: hypothetical protein RMM17_04900 [Acidobacteriota bacterium]|nr:hypothetical protein [Blastocatellia bacterium]MDW8412002.1 hypothetical protein [Acidobacteriota bacterium]
MRLLYDPGFVEMLYSDPDSVLSNSDLTAEEKTELLAIDKRVWRHDPLRRRRTLRTLCEEFKASSTIALAETRSLAALEAFFSSDRFHSSIEQRGSMALAFADFLSDLFTRGDVKAEQFTDVLRLEQTMAKCRRHRPVKHLPLPSKIQDSLTLQLAPGTDVGRFQANVIATIQIVEKYLFEVGLMPAVALCEDAPRLEGLPPVEKKNIYLLFRPGTNGITLVNIDKYDYLLLYEARKSLTVRDLLRRVVQAGLTLRHAEKLLIEALEEGTLLLSPFIYERSH